jgi:hypothetical protein
MTCTSVSTNDIQVSSANDDIVTDELTTVKLFMLNHIRDVNFPAKLLVLYIIFSLLTKNSIVDGTSRYLLMGIGALSLFGLYFYTHMWRNDLRIAMFYGGQFDTLGISPDNVVLIFGFVYLAFALAFWYVVRQKKREMTSSSQENDTGNKRGTRIINCVYFLLAWALVLSIHHFWAAFA